MERYFICCLLIFAFAPIVSFAGNERGGGNAIACLSGGSGQIELLDYYEARLTTNLHIDLGPATSDFRVRLKYVLDRLYKLDAAAAIRYRARAHSFLSEARFISGDELRRISDSNENVKPQPGCRKEQFAIQIFNPRPNQARYLINASIWQSSDSVAKAGLILHELIYRDTVEIAQASSSDLARYLNAELSSREMDRISRPEYLRLLPDELLGLWDCKFSSYIDSLPVCLNGKEWYKDPLPSQKYRIVPDDAPLIYQSGGKSWSITRDQFALANSEKPDVTFDESGRVRTAYINYPVQIQGNSIQIVGIPIDFAAHKEPRLQSGEYQVLAADGNRFPTLKIGGRIFNKVAWIKLEETPEHAFFISEILLFGAGPEMIKLGPWSFDLSNSSLAGVSFYPSGEVKYLCYGDDTGRSSSRVVFPSRSIEAYSGCVGTNLGGFEFENSYSSINLNLARSFGRAS